MLKERIAALEDIPESLRDHYAAGPDGDFELQIEGLDRLRGAKRMEKQKRQNAESRVRELETQLRSARTDPHQKPESEMNPKEKFLQQAQQRLARLLPGSEEYRREFAAIEAEMDPLIAAEVEQASKEGRASIDSLADDYARLRREHEARTIIQAVAGEHAAVLLMPHVLERITVEQRDSEWVVTILDAQGKPTNLEGLRQEFAANSAFAPLLRGESEAEKAAHARRVAEVLGENHGQTKPLSRSTFDALSTASQAHHVRQGGEIFDDIH